jgi:hypothetical protein
MMAQAPTWLDEALEVLRKVDHDPTPVSDEAVVLAIAEVWQRWHVPPDWEAGELARALVQRDSARGRVRVLEQSLAQTKAWLDNSEELRGRAEEERDRARGLAAQLEEEAHREHRSGQHRAGR